MDPVVDPISFLPEDVRKALLQGESQYVEFKRDFSHTATAVREISAMANAHGGLIVVGVNDDGSPAGLSEKSVVRAQDLAARVADSIFPDMRNTFRLTFYSTQVQFGSYILVIKVPDIPAEFKPVRTADGSVYVRRDTRAILKERPDRVSSETKLPHQKKLSIFVAMSFQVDREPALVDYYNAMKRAISRSGISCEIDRVDEVEGDYEVTVKIEEMITSADILIADFTLNSPNVYYEAGIARGAKVYTIRTARKDTEIPFDVGTKKFILYANATQLEASLIGPLQQAYSDIASER